MDRKHCYQLFSFQSASCLWSSWKLLLPFEITATLEENYSHDMNPSIHLIFAIYDFVHNFIMLPLQCSESISEWKLFWTWSRVSQISLFIQVAHLLKMQSWIHGKYPIHQSHSNQWTLLLFFLKTKQIWEKIELNKKFEHITFLGRINSYQYIFFRINLVSFFIMGILKPKLIANSFWNNKIKIIW